MANVVVVGAQWGDEGKGKIVDWLSLEADVVVRFQGGHNAGHTLVIGNETYKLSLLPSGVVRPGKLGVIGNGVVLDPHALVAEIGRLEGQGVAITRDNLRIRGWMGRADQTAKVKGMFVRPEQVAEVAKRHPELGRLRLIVTRAGEADAMTLAAETSAPTEDLRVAVAATLLGVTKLKGAVDFVVPGSLPNDGKVIADERKAE